MMTTTFHIAALGIAASVALAAAARADEDHEASGRAAIEKWVETRRLTSREAQEWRVAKDVLDGRAALLRREVDQFRQQTAQTTNEVGDVDRQLAELRAQNSVLTEAASGLEAAIAGFEARILAALDRVPVPLRERVKPLSQRIVKAPAKDEAKESPKEAAAKSTGASLSERFQNAIGILNEIDKFARDLHVASEIRDLPDGTKAEVSVFYVGLAQAYFCNAAGGIAGTGRPGESGWIWERDDALAAAIMEAIGIYRNERAAAYVRLPATLQ